MKINRKKVEDIFATYVEKYNIKDDKIRLKVEHTYCVARLCEQIAQSEGWEPADVELAWLTGMLHDIGRFEQIRRYGTFEDAKSIDHATFGADLLFKENLIDSFVERDLEIDSIVETAIRCHSLYRLPENLNKREIRFCNVLRDADKIDIFRVNVAFPLEEIYNTTTEELRNSVVSDEVMKSFEERHATLRSLKKTPVDFVAGHISLFFELVYHASALIALEQGYLSKLMDFESNNEKTKQQFRTIKNTIWNYENARKS